MKQILQGIKEVNFEKDGKHIVGTNIFTTFKSAGVTGFKAVKYFLSLELVPEDLEDYVGCEVDVELNEYGKAIQINF